MTAQERINIFADIDQEILDREVEIAFGCNSQDKHFKTRTGTVGALIESLMLVDDGAGIQRVGFERGQKDGRCLLQGGLVAGQHVAKNVTVNHILMVDFDTGFSVGEIADAIAKRGLFALLWTTHSHLKAETVIAEDQLVKWAAHRLVDVALARTYLAEVKRYKAEIAASVTSIERIHIDGGMKFKLAHAPMPRARSLFLLAEPFDFANRGGTQADAILEWKEKYAGFCQALALPFDRSCVDPSRLMFTPRIAKDADETQHKFKLINGRMLSFDDMLRFAADKKTKANGTASTDQEFVTPGFKCFLAEHAHDFEAADWMLEHEPDGMRHDYGDRLDFRCPNEDSHTEQKPDDRAFMVWNASNRDGGFYMGCLHDGCVGASQKDRAWFLDQACQRYGVKHANELLAWCTNACGQENDKSGEELKLKSTQFSDPTADLPDRLRAYNEAYAFVVWGKDNVIVKLNSGGEPIEINRLETFYNRHKNDLALVAGPGAVKPREMAREWMKWQYRATYEAVDFSPANKLPPGVLNFWRGFGVEPSQGDWSHLLRHIFVVTCRENPVYFAAVMCWLADIVQRPEERHNTAIVTIGMPGSGKTTPPWFFSLLMPNNRALISKAHLLTGKFNAPLAHALFVHLEEAIWAGDREAEGVLKSLISEPYHMIERKGLDAQMVPNYARLWMNSNNDWVVPVRPGDRRFLVLRGLDTYATAVASDEVRRAHFDPMYAQMQSKAGLAAMLYDLTHLHQPDWIDLRAPVKTPWLDEQRSATMEPHEAWLFHVLEEAVIAADNGSDFEFGEGGQPGLTVPKDTLRWSFRGFVRDGRRGKGIDVGALGKYLAKFGVKATRPRTENQTRKRCYEFPPLDVMRERFTAEYGVKFDVAVSGEAEAVDVRSAHLSNEEFRDLSTDGINSAELDQWRAYGKGEGGLP